MVAAATLALAHPDKLLCPFLPFANFAIRLGISTSSMRAELGIRADTGPERVTSTKCQQLNSLFRAEPPLTQPVAPAKYNVSSECTERQLMLLQPLASLGFAHLLRR